MTILLCLRKGNLNKTFIQRSGAIKAQTGLEVHALFNDDKLNRLVETCVAENRLQQWRIEVPLICIYVTRDLQRFQV